LSDEKLYVLFVGTDYEAQGGIRDYTFRQYVHGETPAEKILERVIEHARGLAKTSDFFYQGMPEPGMIGVQYQHIDWWHIVEFSSRGMVVVAQGSGGGNEPWVETMEEEEL
jgi:hypothetical protein